MFVLQLFIDVGFKELLFTSDGQDTLDSAFRLRPHEDVLLTVNFMRDRNGLEQLEEFQVGVVCGKISHFSSRKKISFNVCM